MRQGGFQNYSNIEAGRKIVEDQDDDEQDKGKGDSCCNKRWCWWVPRQKSLWVAFSNETSIHGFKFMGQDKRHLSERIFWVVGFLCSFALAGYLIYGVYERYQAVPVIVSFQSSEQDMDSIPFPAVTLCNMNKFPRSEMERIQAIAGNPFHPKYKEARKQLVFAQNACNAQQSFAKDFHFACQRGTNKKTKEQVDLGNATVLTEDDLVEMTDFLMRKTLSCENFIRLCMLGEEPIPCGEIFKPVITDYGKCCVFNILPLPLLLRNPDMPLNPDKIEDLYINPVLGSDASINWPVSMLREWKKWNYEEGFVMAPELKRPWRQKRAGLPYGLSILLDPNTADYFCPSSDSTGMRYLLHTPLEMPHVMEFSSVAHLNKEILIEVHPDVTNADDDIRSIEPKKRMCYFGIEKSLKFFGPYTGGNCVDECTARELALHCNCTLFYMPRDDGVRICDSDPTSKDFECTENILHDMQKHMEESCGDCETLCEDIAYNYETTIADLQPHESLWGDPNPAKHPNGTPEWVEHKMSIVHIFFGAESTVPKFRKRLYGTTDLIANTGGILGLCLGFSILSGIEVLYFLTLRAFWKFCRKRRLKKQAEMQHDENTNTFLAQLLFQNQNNKVIQLNPNMIPVYPHDMAAGGRWNHVVKQAKIKGGWGNNQGHHFYNAQSFQPPKSSNKNMGYSNYY